MMNSFPKNIKFKHPWRKYQHRVLEELESHLEDKRLHVIAPPGSGKTVLGLEVMRHLNHSTLILAPTLTIRNQWVDRFVESFLPPNSSKPDWISSDLKKPEFVTAVTYQGLHALAKSENSITSLLEESNFQTIIVDEAHHLKNEWWKSLDSLRKALPHATIVALTATPPYDVSYNEWLRYKELCGPRDSEINVPELLLEKNLCPHQDYTYFSLPTTDESKISKEFHAEVKRFYKDITEIEPHFADALFHHPWIRESEKFTEEILDNPAYFSSMLVFLNHMNWPFPEETLTLLNVAQSNIPPLDLEWLELLLTGVLIEDKDNYPKIDDLSHKIIKRLSPIGAIDKRKVSLRKPEKLSKTFAKSVGKLESIVEIVKSEVNSLGSSMRMVVLCDYIHKTDMPNFGDEPKPMKRIGVVSVFEHLRRQYIYDIKLGILCGSYVVIPESAVTDFEIMTTLSNIPFENFKLTPLSHDPGYVVVEGIGNAKKQLVKLVTSIFTRGNIILLIGTTSLLGEGWDAPAINSLILATFVGSYVLSNQMRGRAIRTDSENSHKTSNIWHLACVEEGAVRSGDDFANLIRRFKTFVGVSFDGTSIENGISRLELHESIFETKSISDVNQMMLLNALNRNKMRTNWAHALKNGKYNSTVIEELSAHSKQVPKALTIKKTKISFAGVGLVTALWGGLAALSFFYNSDAVTLSLAACLLIFSGLTVPKWIKNIWALAKYGQSEWTLKQISDLLLTVLAELDFIKTDRSALHIVTTKNNDDTIFCHLREGTSFEKSLFLDSLEELIEPVENPRYLIAWNNPELQGMDYYAVPKLIAQKKEYSKILLQRWIKNIGHAELIYTRSAKGRKELLKARMKGLGSHAHGELERAMIWK